MRLKIKPDKTYLDGLKMYKEEIVYVQRDEFGDKVREQYHPFSNAKKEKKITFLGELEEAPF
jgi:hypothetical protein